MKYYKSKTGDVYAYDEEQVVSGIVPEEFKALTQTEVQKHLSPKLTREIVEQLRLQAYSDPLTGSDRYFAETARLNAVGADASEIENASTKGITRYKEIQDNFPWPSL